MDLVDTRHLLNWKFVTILFHHLGFPPIEPDPFQLLCSFFRSYNKSDPCWFNPARILTPQPAQCNPFERHLFLEVLFLFRTDYGAFCVFNVPGGIVSDGAQRYGLSPSDNTSPLGFPSSVSYPIAFMANSVSCALSA